VVGEFDGDTRLVVAFVSARGSISDVVCCAPCVYDGNGGGGCRILGRSGGIGSTLWNGGMILGGEGAKFKSVRGVTCKSKPLRSLT
jgi:hypothetical protein